MIKIIDLFAGIGGIRRGFEEAGGDNITCVFTSEYDKFAVMTYRANYPNDEVNGDITQIQAESIPDHDILLAGFPCQPFSQAGLKMGFDDETRGTLFFEIEKIIKAKNPRVLLLENVAHLKTHDQGRTLRTIINHLEMAGYKVSFKLLKARDFGVPQNRERIYICGFLDHNIDFRFPSGINNVPNVVRPKLGDILESQIDSKYTLSNKLWEGHQRRKLEHQHKGYGFGYVLFNEDSEYTQTLSARYYKDGSEILIDQSPMNPRKLTPRECARLQGYPDSFVIPVSNVQAYKQFGNSVAVPVIKAIASNMLKAIKVSTDDMAT